MSTLTPAQTRELLAESAALTDIRERLRAAADCPGMLPPDLSAS